MKTRTLVHVTNEQKKKQNNKKQEKKKKKTQAAGLTPWLSRLLVWFLPDGFVLSFFTLFLGQGKEGGVQPLPIFQPLCNMRMPSNGEAHSYSCREAQFAPGTGHNSFLYNVRFLSRMSYTGQASRQITVLSCHLPSKNLKQTNKV